MPKAAPKNEAPVVQVEDPKDGTPKSGLGLTPNEVVGYRIVPDWYSFNVQLIKRRGKSSKNAGEEYGETLGYCKNLPFAVQYIVSHATRMYGEELQNASLEITKTVGDAKALEVAIAKAEGVALAAVAELTARINALGLDQKSLVKALGGMSDAPDDAANQDA